MIEAEGNVPKDVMQRATSRPGEIRRLAFFTDRGVYVPKNGSQEVFTRVTPPSQRTPLPRKG